jgi:hypothetical protein
MGSAVAFGLLAALVGLEGDDSPKPGVRYGVTADLKSYPQTGPKETLSSVLKAAEAGRFDYVVAQLADPAWVDERIDRLYHGRFEEQFADTRQRLDSATIKLLRRFLAEGEWTADKDAASVRVKDVSDRGVFFVRRGDRWYLEHRSKPGS